MLPDKENIVGRTGSVFVRDFDEGVVKTIGAEIVHVNLDGSEVPFYAVRIGGVDGPHEFGGFVPVMMSHPEDVYAETFLPYILVMRSSMSRAFQRWMYGGYEYMIDTGRLETGARIVEIKDWSMPYDITYDISVKARLRSEADRIMKHVGGIFLTGQSQVWVTDSLGVERGYDCIGESIDPLDEVNDVTNRSVGYTISIRVMGELDFRDPVKRLAADKLSVNVEVVGE